MKKPKKQKGHLSDTNTASSAKINWLLMRDGLVLGEFIQDNKGILRFIKDKGIDDNWLPYCLDKHIGKDASIYLNEWLKERVVPENRINVKKLLHILGLKKYDYIELAQITRATLMSDPYWLAMEEGDTFSTKSLRGRLEINIARANKLKNNTKEEFRWRI